MRRSYLVRVFSCLLTVTTIGCSGIKNETADKEISDLTVISFVSEVIYSDSIDTGLCDSKLYAGILLPSIGKSDTLLLKIDPIFSKEDREYILKQAAQSDSIILTSKLIPGITFIPPDTVYSWRSKRSDRWLTYFNYYKKGYHYIALPHFSKDHLKAIVFIGCACGGLCGYSEYRIYQKKSNKWILYNTIGQRIS